MDILQRIVADTKQTVAERRARLPLAELKAKVANGEGLGRANAPLSRALQHGRPLVIAEFKRKSPSKPDIALHADPVVQAQIYADGGASAISVLTEPDYFAGSLDDLRAIRQAVDVPLLRKDFIVDPYQIYEARANGADLVLLIARVLDAPAVAEFTALTHALGMEVLFEIHGLDELAVLDQAPVDFLGANCRDLTKFETSLDRLIAIAPELRQRCPSAILVAESGIKTGEDVARLWAAGYRGFLIGEALMRGNTRQLLTEMTADMSSGAATEGRQ